MSITLETIRKKLGINQEMMANILGLNRTTWANVEAGRYTTQAGRLMRLIPYQELVIGLDQPTPASSTAFQHMMNHVKILTESTLAVEHRNLNLAERKLANLRTRWHEIQVVLYNIESRLADPEYADIPKDILNVFRNHQLEFAETCSPYLQLKAELEVVSARAKIAVLEDHLKTL